MDENDWKNPNSGLLSFYSIEEREGNARRAFPSIEAQLCWAGCGWEISLHQLIWESMEQLLNFPLPRFTHYSHLIYCWCIWCHSQKNWFLLNSRIDPPFEYKRNLSSRSKMSITSSLLIWPKDSPFNILSTRMNRIWFARKFSAHYPLFRNFEKTTLSSFGINKQIADGSIRWKKNLKNIQIKIRTNSCTFHFHVNRNTLLTSVRWNLTNRSAHLSIT